MSTTANNNTATTASGSNINAKEDSAMASSSSSNVNNVMKELLQAFHESDKYKDITFIIAKTEVPANELMVKLRSPVLKEKLEDPNRDKMITLDDQNVEDFKKFLQFLSTDDCDITSQNVTGLFLLGKKYDVPSFCKKCLDFLETTLTKDSAQSFAAFSYKNPELKEIFEKCLVVFPNVMDKLSFYSVDKLGNPASVFPSNLVQHMLQQERGDDAEEALFAKVYDWAKVYCRINGLKEESSNIKDAMKDLIPYIRFGNLTGATLSKIVRPTNLLSEARLLDAFCSSALKSESHGKAKAKTSSAIKAQSKAKTVAAASKAEGKQEVKTAPVEGKKEVAAPKKEVAAPVKAEPEAKPEVKTAVADASTKNQPEAPAVAAEVQQDAVAADVVENGKAAVSREPIVY